MILILKIIYFCMFYFLFSCVIFPSKVGYLSYVKRIEFKYTECKVNKGCQYNFGGWCTKLGSIIEAGSTSLASVIQI